ncbi:DUF5681 domain-containing protein [Methylobacterium oryzae CBMB20]
MRGDGKPFAEGQSGNPAGRPKDARNRVTATRPAVDGAGRGAVGRSPACVFRASQMLKPSTSAE